MEDLNPSVESFSRLCLKNYKGYRLYYEQDLSNNERTALIEALESIIRDSTPPIERIELHQKGLLIIAFTGMTKVYRVSLDG